MNWNWREFLYDVEVMAMSPLALGMYVRVLGAAALSEEPGHIKGGEDAMRRLSGASHDEWMTCGATVLGRFRAVDGGYLHVRTRRDHQAQTDRIDRIAARRSEAGKQGNQVRWQIRDRSQTDRNVIANASPPSLLHSTEEESKEHVKIVRPRASRSAVSVEPPGFADWYQAYPRHVARRAAARAYRAALQRGMMADTLAEGARRYSDEVGGRDVNLIKHPATWLNGDCCLDELNKVGGEPLDETNALLARIKARMASGAVESRR